MSQAEKLLSRLNSEYLDLHKKFEDLFWAVRMGDLMLSGKLNEAEKELDLFRSSPDNLKLVADLIESPDAAPVERERLKIWENFFRLYRTPPDLRVLRDEIAALESVIDEKLATANEGYADPKTGEFVPCSKIKMRMTVRTDADERMRKACWTALEGMATMVLDDYVKLVGMRNRYARALGFEDFYAYRVRISEGMEKKQIFGIFDEIHEGTKGTFDKIRELEKERPGLRKPWNFGFMMSGSFLEEEDQYYDFDDALMRWGRSFSALGIDYKGGTLQLDLLDRKNKYNNGFCHYPSIVNFERGKREPGSANFTCNVVYGQVGAGALGLNTLFHEGGHAADRLNSYEREVCLSTEYPPASTAWAETHSQFLDTMLSSVEWRTRYAVDKSGRPYPFDLFERKVRKLRILAPLGLASIMMVSEFERRMYEAPNLSAEKALEMARDVGRKYNDFDGDTLLVLTVPHIYSWNSSAYYHAYGLAVLALEQWREYFYGKYGFIVDNPAVGREMTAVWRLGSSKTFAEFVELATGRPLSPEAFIKDATMDVEKYLIRAKERVRKMAEVPAYDKPVDLNAFVRMVHGKEVVADSSESFEKMAQKYTEWLHSRRTV